MNWNDWILGNELAIRLSFFCSVFALIAIWEIRSPRRKLTVSKG
ncbi:MAG: sterol desaturase family protein, partial [Gammaproteobacteria bacterium]|nr:sterol desaturase family protein [Gammaproteobacteria bacterium]